MAELRLYSWQEEALRKMKNGCILNGDVGSGKSLTSLAYYCSLFGGEFNTGHKPVLYQPCDLYIITTARKRDTREWEKDMLFVGMSTDPKYNCQDNRVYVDSWNNINKYANVKDAFFIFDEQRVVGYGAWTKSFLEITRKNRWILLSATPGDCWMDYMPVFLAHRFYMNKTDFCNQHVVYDPYVKFPKVKKYINEEKLQKYKDYLLIPMECRKRTVRRKLNIDVDYDKDTYKSIGRNRWNIYKDKPIQNAGEHCLVLRRIVNSDETRRWKMLDILAFHPKAIIFYSHNYELDILRDFFDAIGYPYSEWNGQKHEKILDADKWVYLVEYTAGAEGWNCITTNCEIFYSLNYSYKITEQAMGRIDRINTPYEELYYYFLVSKSPIDRSISAALSKKKKFNELKFAPEYKENK